MHTSIAIINRTTIMIITAVAAWTIWRAMSVHWLMSKMIKSTRFCWSKWKNMKLIRHTMRRRCRRQAQHHRRYFHSPMDAAAKRARKRYQQIFLYRFNRNSLRLNGGDLCVCVCVHQLNRFSFFAFVSIMPALFFSPRSLHSVAAVWPYVCTLWIERGTLWMTKKKKTIMNWHFRQSNMFFHLTPNWKLYA